MSERETLARIAAAMRCVPDDDADLVEAVRESVRERDEAIARADAAEAGLAEVRDAARAVLLYGSDDGLTTRDYQPIAPGSGPFATLRTALAALPADLAAERDRRVRAEALGEAADAYDRGDMLTSDLSTGLGAWLRSRAADERGGR